MRLIRVFPRKTKATPDDDLAYVGPPDLFTPRDVDAVHISVSFTWDRDRAEQLAEQWRRIRTPAHATNGHGRDAPGPEWRAFQRRWARPAIIHASHEEAGVQ